MTQSESERRAEAHALIRKNRERILKRLDELAPLNKSNAEIADELEVSENTVRSLKKGETKMKTAVKTYQEGIDVLDQMNEFIDAYGKVTLAEYEMIKGHELNNYSNTTKGWTDLSGASLIHHKDGAPWLLTLPDPKPFTSDSRRQQKGEKKMKKVSKKQVLKAAIVVGAGIALYKMGERNGFELGYDFGELHGFKDAVKAVTEGTIDAYNLGDLDMMEGN